MNFLAVATDYDGTLAYSGKVRDSTIEALESLRESGRMLLLVTGRQLEELLEIFPRPELFEWIVAENGALLYCPRMREMRLLADAVPPDFPRVLRERGVEKLQIGHSIVATWLPHECTVLEVLRDLGLDRQIVFNKDAVMVLPTGINKASGLSAALAEMKLSPHNVVAVGDAENDLPMLAMCECGVAVDNALDSVKAKADLVMRADHGAGVEELIAALLKDDLATAMSSQHRRGLLVGNARDDANRLVYVPSLGHSILVAGPSGSGKSTAITGLLERMAKAAYQFCIVDPEGDYENFEPAISLGNPHYVPSADDAASLLERMHNVTVNLLGAALEARPELASELLRKLEHMRSGKGRPHWFVLDEAHHIFPSEQPAGSTLLLAPPKGSLMITVHPDHVHQQALASADIVIAVGKEPHETIRNYCRAVQVAEPECRPVTLEHGQVLVWFRDSAEPPLVVVAEPGKTEHKRHIRKYAEGDLGLGSFVFRGPEDRLHLVAQNLSTFVRMAQGVDDETWCHHLRSGHFSEWFRWIVKNKELADQVRTIEQENGSADETRRKMIEAIQTRYTLAA